MSLAGFYRHTISVHLLIGAALLLCSCEKFPEPLPESHFEAADEDVTTGVKDVEDPADIAWDISESDTWNTPYICEGEEAIVCDDENPCTIDTCDTKEGCLYESADECDDGDVCTLNDTCIENECVSGTESLDCDDDNPCTDDSCDALSGCVQQNNTVDCEVGDICSTSASCVEGECVSNAKQDCDDGNACTTGTCISENDTGCTYSNVDGECDDDDECTLEDFCEQGECSGFDGELDCDDGEVCTLDECDPTDGCDHSPVGGSCDDNNECTSGDTCDSGICTSGAQVQCDDENICTSDSCDPEAGCQYEENDFACDDGLHCTASSACSGGSCVGTSDVDCSVQDSCKTGVCNEVNDQCEVENLGVTAPCDDGDPCTSEDQCDGLGWCGGSEVVCNDNLSCTLDECNTDGECVTTGIVEGYCLIDGQCYGEGATTDESSCAECIPQTSQTEWTLSGNGSPCSLGNCYTEGSCLGGECTNSVVLQCPDDDNPCTVPNCSESEGCGYVFKADSSPCGDAGDLCSGVGVCLFGQCTAEPLDCDDEIECTLDYCDPLAACQHFHDSDSCNDDNLCTNDWCSPEQGCIYGSNNTDGIYCDDGDPCTSNDICDAGECTGTPNPGSGAGGLSCTNLFCGDLCCGGMDEQMTCPQDCTTQQGGCDLDGFCSDTEDCESCPEDCGACNDCGNGVCDCDLGETCNNCSADCICDTWDAIPAGCFVKDTSGCTGCDCQQCVCQQNSACCTSEWTAECVQLCEGCGGCDAVACPDCYGGLWAAGLFGGTLSLPYTAAGVVAQDAGEGLKFDAVVAGTFYDSISFNGEDTLYSYSTVSTQAQGYLAKLSYDGGFDLNDGYVFGSNDAEVHITALAQSPQNESVLYVAGSFEGTWDDYIGSTPFTYNSGAQRDGFLAKVTDSGILWIKPLSTTGAVTITGLTVTNKGPVITGTFGGSNVVAFGNTYSNYGVNSTPFFAIQTDPIGQPLWGTVCSTNETIAEVGSSPSIASRGIAWDSGDNVYLTGSFNESLQCNGMGPVLTTSTPGEVSPDLFVIRLSDTGIVQWMTQGSGSGYQSGLSVVANSQGAVFVGGAFSNSITIDGEVLGGSAGASNEQFIAKLNAGYGTLIKAQKLGSEGIPNKPLALALTDNDYLIVGSNNDGGALFPNTDIAITGGNSSQAYIAKFNTATLNAIWATGFNTQSGDAPIAIHALTQSNSGIYAVGTFTGSVTSDDGYPPISNPEGDFAEDNMLLHLGK